MIRDAEKSQNMWPGSWRPGRADISIRLNPGEKGSSSPSWAGGVASYSVLLFYSDSKID